MPISELTGDENMENCRTFVIENEDHTLAGTLKYLIGRYEDVQFCGYTIPHPAENKVHLRVQANAGVRATEVLKRALTETVTICDLMVDKFTESQAKGSKQ